jgi:hypothetical protein
MSSAFNAACNAAVQRMNCCRLMIVSKQPLQGQWLVALIAAVLHALD